ncbi:MAG: S8 family serine peptidase [Saprospiraceae bacterium]
MDSTFLIGHLDSGSRPDHPSFNGKIDESIAFNKSGILQNEPLKSSHHSHSSLSARIIFRDDSYSLPALPATAKLAAVSIPSRGKTILNFLKGMDFLLGLSPQIVCMPIGFRKSTPIFYPMICAFHEKGILTIVPIGNNGAGNAQVPGCYPKVISVGAIDADGKVAKYSGSYLDDSESCLKPDILAAGDSLPIGKQLNKKGTSFACSYITGIAARLLQAQPLATMEEIKVALFSSTQSLLPSQSHRCKRGIVQPEAALEFLLQKKKITSPKLNEVFPSFVDKRYQDRRFVSQFKNATPGQLLEAIIIPSASLVTVNDTKISSPKSQELIFQIQKSKGVVPESTYFFRHADMMHVIARSDFFEELLRNPELFSISAVDVNIFEM